MSSFEDLLTRLLPIFSNLVFLATAARFMEYGDKDRAFFYLLIALFTSPVYHLCMGFPKTCFWHVFKYHVLDFWFAELSIPLLALRFIRFRDPAVERWIFYVSVIVIGILVTGTNSSFAGQAVVGGVSIGLVVLYVAWHVRVHGYWPDYDIFQLTMGTGFTAVGVCFFVVQDWWPPYYGYNHSCWHALVAVGSVFFAGVRPPDDENTQEPVGRLARVARELTARIEHAVPPLRTKWGPPSGRVGVASARTPSSTTWIDRLSFAPMTTQKTSLP